MNDYLITYEKVDGIKSSTTVRDITPEHARETLKRHLLGIKKILTTVKVKNKIKTFYKND